MVSDYIQYDEVYHDRSIWKYFLVACLCYVFTTCIERVFKGTVSQTIMFFIETQRKVDKACKMHIHGRIRYWKRRWMDKGCKMPVHGRMRWRKIKISINLISFEQIIHNNIYLKDHLFLTFKYTKYFKYFDSNTRIRIKTSK